jgi:ABC-2 type transport system permease protein
MVIIDVALILLVVALFIVAAGVLQILASKLRPAMFAIVRRNVVSYFSSPTGYVFICVFVLLSGIAAFWPDDFFNSNLANLDQLNRFLPFIMLVFIPAISMGIWADERRQGTDELLLTVPATDLDVVLGKYLAAVSIFSVSLAFSLVSNFAVLRSLGDPDMGLFLATYFGYWLVGVAMLAIGMVASFLSGNLTIGFILGVLFNAPLAFFGSAVVINVGNFGVNLSFLDFLKSWSFAERFRDMGRGLISLSGVTFFVMIVVIMIYLSIVLIGRRHWLGGKDGKSLLWHYVVRALAVAAVGIGLTFVFTNRDVIRLDLTQERLSSLSPHTRGLLGNIDTKDRVVRIDAYVSPEVPEAYVQTRLNLLGTLREMANVNRGVIQLTVHDTESFSTAAQQAEEQYKITGRQVLTKTRGSYAQDEIYLGVAVSCGRKTVVTPFFDRGVPVEYEILRSIATVADEKKKKLGVLNTDARLFGGMDMQTFAMRPDEEIVAELKKQFEVVQVDPSSPIQERYDVLLAVQPSTLTFDQMKNLVDAIRAGQPTLICEDPCPLTSNVTATSQPRMPQQPMGMFGGGGMPEPKGDINLLWDALGVNFDDKRIISQFYNPYPRIGEWPDQLIFVDAASSQEPFNPDEGLCSDLEQVLFLFPGSFTPKNATSLDFERLVASGDIIQSGFIEFDDLWDISGFGGRQLKDRPAIRAMVRPASDNYILAARVHGVLKPENVPMNDEGSPLAQEGQPDNPPAAPTGDPAAAASSQPPAEPPPAEPFPPGAPPAGGESPVPPPAEGTGSESPAPPATNEINVILVADIDFFGSQFFSIRARGDDPDALQTLSLDNVTFILNALDSLSGEERFMEVRSRRPKHRTLKTIEALTEGARDEAVEQREQFVKSAQEAIEKRQNEFNETIQRLQSEAGSDLKKLQELEIRRNSLQKQLDVEIDRLRREQEDKQLSIERTLNREIRSIQDKYKFWAVMIPPLPPLLLGLVVWLRRLAQESEGVSQTRLR